MAGGPQDRSGDFPFARAWTGTFLSALDMPGFLLPVMSVDTERLGHLDAMTSAPAWPGLGKIGEEISILADSAMPFESKAVAGDADRSGLLVRKAALAAADALVVAEFTLTKLDSVAGDSDLGSGMKRAAEAMYAHRSWVALILAAARDPRANSYFVIVHEIRRDVGTPGVERIVRRMVAGGPIAIDRHIIDIG
jgi:hypothetical protein